MAVESHFIFGVADQGRGAGCCANVPGGAPRLDEPGMTEFVLPGGGGARRSVADHAP